MYLFQNEYLHFFFHDILYIQSFPHQFQQDCIALFTTNTSELNARTSLNMPWCDSPMPPSEWSNKMTLPWMNPTELVWYIFQPSPMQSVACCFAKFSLFKKKASSLWVRIPCLWSSCAYTQLDQLNHPIRQTRDIIMLILWWWNSFLHGKMTTNKVIMDPAPSQQRIAPFTYCVIITPHCQSVMMSAMCRQLPQMGSTVNGILQNNLLIITPL